MLIAKLNAKIGGHRILAIFESPNTDKRFGAYRTRDAEIRGQKYG